MCLTLIVLALSFLTSCSSSKSNQIAENSSRADINTLQALANCNSFNSTDTNFNLAAVIEKTTGEINLDWIKFKINFLSLDMTQTGLVIKFFKWRILNNKAELDANPLAFTTYSLSSGQTNSETLYSFPANKINKQNAFYIRLNDDPVNPYQVFKFVVYKADGSIAHQSDVLIPQFSASPVDYKTTANGTARSENLLKLHPLYSTDVSSWSQLELIKNYDQYCF